MIINKLIIEGVDYSADVSLPLQFQNTLDESLDVAYVELKGVTRETPFRPFAEVEIQLEDTGVIRDYYFRIESDEVTEIISNRSYNHNILLIEETKILERYFVEKNIRQPLVRNFWGAKKEVEPDITFMTENAGLAKPNKIERYASPIEAYQEFTFLSPHDVYNMTVNNPLWDGLPETIEVYKRYNRGTDSELGYVLIFSDTSGYPNNTSFTTVLEPADYLVKYSYWAKLGTLDIRLDFQFEFSAITQAEPKSLYTIRDTINMLLQTTKILRESEQPMFTLAEPRDYHESAEYQARIEEILATQSPEFTFAKMSLFEALQMVGQSQHFIPRLRRGKIYFDLLGQTEKIESELEDYLSHTLSQSTNEFCTKLDSQVNNLVNMDDEQQGSITTPFNGGYRTLRAETGTVVMTDTGLIIPTENNIEKIVKLEIGYLSDGTFIGDITPYVYESAEYNILDSYSSEYPTARMYALKFTKGQPNITELGFERQNVVSQAFEGLAIKNIIYRQSGKGVNWWNNLWDTENIFKLQYRLTYIPSTNAYVTQSKSYTEDIVEEISLAYNQGASKVSSNAYGENLKGTVAKFGNIEKTKTYIFPHFQHLPDVGKMVDDDYYISTVKYEVYPNFVKCEIGLSKNYNNKNAYVELDTSLEFFEYSRSIITDRFIVYEDYCEIGLDSTTDSKALITDLGIDKFASAFEFGTQGDDVSLVKAQGFDINGNDLGEFVLPVLTLGIGNSILLSYHYEDSVSAGNTASYVGDQRIQNFAKYVDEYGEIETLRLQFGNNAESYDTYSKAVALGDTIPRTDNLGAVNIYFDTTGDNLKIVKGVAEIPYFSYQMHFVANQKSLIIGSGLASKNPLTSKETQENKLFLLKNKINKFENRINLTNAIALDTLTISKDYSKRQVKIDDFVVPDGEWEAWAIVQTYNNQNVLIIGENKKIKSGDTVAMPYFTFKRKITEE
ncbi:MAG: hypothetical protein J6A98_00725 [Clostridia bacterium]|nr:hypothetical protein [Clostridia bacterium]